MGGFVPYARKPFEPGGDNIAELLARQGEIAARRAEQSGAIWGNAVQNIGQQIGGAIQQYGQKKEDSKRALAFDAAVASGDPKRIISVLGPRDGPAVINALKAHAPDGLKEYGDRQTLLRDQARGVLAVPPERRQAAYDFAVKGLVSNGVLKQEEVVPYDENVLKQLASYGTTPEKPKGLTEVNAGASLYDPEQQKAVFTAPTKPEKAPGLQHVETAAGIQSFNPETGQLGPVIAKGKPNAPKEPKEPKWTQGEDAQGNPILYDTASGAVKPFPEGVTPKAGAAEAGRIAGAKAALESSSEIHKYLSKPEVRKAIGPLIGRYNSLAQAAGVGDPVAVELVGMLKSYAAMQPNIHGFRAVKFASDIEGLLTTKQTPETLEAAIRGIDTAAMNVRDRGRHPAGATNTEPDAKKKNPFR